jgi:hypothetical protein
MIRNLLLFIAVLFVSSFSSSTVLIAQASAANSGDVVVQTVEGESVGKKLGTKAKSSWPWYVIRGSGMVAAIALTVLILSGIGQVTGYTYRFLDPLTAWASHRALGITFGVAVLVHMFSLLFDHFIPFNIFQLFVPWLSNYKPAIIFGMHVGSLWVALGVIAFYLAGIVVITSLIWVEKKPYLWKYLHLLSYLIILFVFVHALYLGTDLSHGIIRTIWWVSGAGIVAAVLHRAWRAYTT